MKPRVVNGAEFPAAIAEGIVIVDFWAAWCLKCNAFAAVATRVAAANPEVAFITIDTDREPGLSEALGVHAMPTLMAFRDGVMLFREAGLFEDEAIQTLITKIADVDMDAIRARLEEQAAGEESIGADASA